MEIKNARRYYASTRIIHEKLSLPKGKRAIGYGWIYIVKHNCDAAVQWVITRLVSKGYTQTYGVYYFETFPLVAKLNSITIIISQGTQYD